MPITRRRFVASVAASLAALTLTGCNRPNRIKLKKLNNVTEVSCDDPDTLFNFWDYYQTNLWPDYKKHTANELMAKDIATVADQAPKGKLYLWNKGKFAEESLDMAIAKSKFNGVIVTHT